MERSPKAADQLEAVQASVEDLYATILISLPQGKLGMQQAAELLGFSVRTLQRRLAAAGTTYSRLVNRVRHEEACRLLGETDLPVSVVSTMLGYSEPSAFSRAFQRWTGVSPRHFRVTRTRSAVREDERG